MFERFARKCARALVRGWKAMAAAGAAAAAGVAAAGAWGGGGDALLVALVVGGIACAWGIAWGILNTRTAENAAEAVRAALERDTDAWLLIDGEGVVREASRAFPTLFPLADDERPSLESLRATLVEAESFEDLDRLRAAGRVGERARAEVLTRGRTGGREWRGITVLPVPGAGREGWSLWRVEDVTPARELDAARRAEEETLIDFLDNMPVGFAASAPDGRLLHANATLGGWLGIGPADLHAHRLRLADFAHPVPGGEAGAEPGPVPVPAGEVALRGPDGATFRALALNAERHGAAGEILYTRSVIVPGPVAGADDEDGGEGAPRWLFTDAPVGIAVLDLRGAVADCNRSFLRILGLHRDMVAGRPLADLIRKEDRDDVGAQLSKIVMGAVPAAHLEVRMAAAGKREPIVSLYAGRVTDSGGDILGIVVHAIDTTERKILEVQFAQSQRIQAVGQLAGGVAHDFNNLLTAMIGFCDLLLERHGPEDSSFADIMQIKQNANRATNLVRQLLAFSRKQTLQPVELDVTEALAELTNLLRRLLGEPIELRLEHGRDLGTVRVDPGQFDQVIVNLAVNARDAMPSGGALTIRTSSVGVREPLARGAEIVPPGAYLLIEIADTGIGIPKENIGRIFEPFFSTKEVGEGTGLGLSTVFGIIKQTGGFIFVDSAPGEGTTFAIYLPRSDGGAATRAGPPARTPQAPPARDLTGIGTILLVEDEDAVRMFGARALRNKGYQVLEAENGERALEVVNAAGRQIDLVISDVVMPGMDGQTLVRLLRHEMPTVRVILTSGYAENVLPDEIGRDPNVNFLPKPFTLKDLAAKVKDVMGR